MIVAIGCGASGTDSEATPSTQPSDVSPVPASIVIQPAAPTIAVGATVQLSAAVLSSAGSSAHVDQSVTWHSLSPSRMSVSSSGLVTGLSAGQGTINANSVQTPTVFAGVTVTITP